jgi:hypothetical protein
MLDFEMRDFEMCDFEMCDFGRGADLTTLPLNGNGWSA